MAYKRSGVQVSLAPPQITMEQLSTESTIPYEPIFSTPVEEPIDVTGNGLPESVAINSVRPVESPDPFGALKVWLAPSRMGAEIFRDENHHGRR